MSNKLITMTLVTFKDLVKTSVHKSRSGSSYNHYSLVCTASLSVSYSMIISFLKFYDSAKLI